MLADLYKEKTKIPVLREFEWQFMTFRSPENYIQCLFSEKQYLKAANIAR